VPGPVRLFSRSAVGRQSAQRPQREDRDLRAEPGCAEQQLRVCQAVDKPTLGDVLHPGPDERDDLTGDEEAKIAVPQGAEGVWNLMKSGWRLFAGLDMR